MNYKIVDAISRFESDLDVQVLLACETGSRAWGFASPDSDFDIRLVYYHPVDWYLSVSEHSDSFSVMLENGLIDITGWELRKALRLLTKSNMSILERLDSPIVYKEDPSSASELRALAKGFFNPLAGLHHYRGMAKSARAELDKTRPYRLKRLFYALRAGACCQWIYEQKAGSPPIVFDQVLAEIDLDNNVINRIEELKEIKSVQPESYEHSGEILLLDLIDTQIASAKQKADSLSVSQKPERRLLLDEFLATVILEKPQ